MPMRVPLARLNDELGKTPDVLLCCASFEQRCTSIPTSLAGEALQHVLVFQNRWLKGATQANGRLLRNRFGRKTMAVQYDGLNPLSFADQARIALNKVLTGSPQHYLVDVTTFTHENLLILLSLLREIKRSDDTVTIAYAAAADYMIAGGEWLSRAFGDVRSVLGYPGEMRPSRAEHLIVMFGYEDERAERLIRMYEPAHLSVGHCQEFAAIAPNLHQRNLEFHGRLLQFRQQVHSFEFGCDDPYTACEHILREAQRLPEYNAVVAPMNTKLSTVGAALAVFRQPSIQLCYVPARDYNEHGYSAPGDGCYIFELNL